MFNSKYNISYGRRTNNKYTFDKEDSHDIAKRIVDRDKKKLKKILYENGEA